MEGLSSDTQKTLNLLVLLSHSLEESFSPTRRNRIPNPFEVLGSRRVHDLSQLPGIWLEPAVLPCRACLRTCGTQDRVAQYREKS
jgi:hypothetical protein